VSGAALLAPAALVGQAVPCRPDIAALTDPALFARYPARSAAPSRWRAADVRRGWARTYRTMLRRYGGGPADLAGAYRVVGIGCGASAVCAAFVDGRSGRVIFAPALREVSAMTFEADVGFEMLTYRRDSRPPAVIGAPNEDERRRAVSHYDSRDGRPRRVGFLGTRDFCAGRRAKL